MLFVQLFSICWAYQHLIEMAYFISASLIILPKIYWPSMESNTTFIEAFTLVKLKPFGKAK
jgi:hypothetical protein